MAIVFIAATTIYGGDQSCGCAAGASDGINHARGYTTCLLVETPAFSGTADSMVFAARDFGANGADTFYVAVYTMDTDSSVKDLVALSPDSIEATNSASYEHFSLALSGESISASTALHLCITCRGTDVNGRPECCSDGGLGSQNCGVGTDTWPLDDPSSLAFNTAYYAPNIVLWYTTSDGTPVSTKLGAVHLGKVSK